MRDEFLKLLRTFPAVAFLCGLLFSNPIFAAGTLDQTFGTGGIANFRLGGTNQAIGAALQPDGKIVVLGITRPSGQSSGFNDISLARLNANGTLDTAFGTGGFVQTDFDHEQEYMGAIVILPDGKILIGGSRQTIFQNSINFAMARYNPDGSLDATFGTGGKVVTDFPESTGEGISYLIPQADGKFIAAGKLYVTNSGFNPDQIAFVRYNADGSIDSTYGNNGALKLMFESSITGFYGFALQPDGKIVVSASFTYRIPGCTPTKGNSCNANQYILMRYHANLTRDRKFGRRAGKEYLRQTYGIYPQADGTILLGGFPRVVRFTYNGHHDTVFDFADFPNQPPGVQNGPAYLTVRPNGTIVGCRFLTGGIGYDLGLVLFTPGGQVIGYEQRNFFGGDDYCTGILNETDGKFLVIVSTQLQSQGNYSISVVRYLDIVP
jgi:uncharacterized delta-60 repeat protein